MYKLISLSVCPFVQRAVMLLREKGVEHEVQYIDLANKPDWFLEISPRGKVPVLVVDGTPLFESQAICEFLEEENPEPALMPKNSIERARDRAWFAFASEDLFMPLFRMMYAPEEKQARGAYEQIREKLARLETELEGREFLSGDGSKFGMADLAMVPFMFRAEWIVAQGCVDVLDGHPKLQAWAKRCLARDTVPVSVPESFDADQKNGVTQAGSWVMANPGALS